MTSVWSHPSAKAVSEITGKAQRRHKARTVLLSLQKWMALDCFVKVVLFFPLAWELEASDTATKQERVQLQMDLKILFIKFPWDLMGYVIETVGVLSSMINIFNSQLTKELMQI